MPAKRRALRELQKPLNDLRASPVYPVFEDEQSKGRQKIGQAKNRLISIMLEQLNTIKTKYQSYTSVKTGGLLQKYQIISF